MKVTKEMCFITNHQPPSASLLREKPNVDGGVGNKTNGFLYNPVSSI